MDNHNLSEYHCSHCDREFVIAEIGDIKYCPNYGRKLDENTKYEVTEWL